MKYLDLSEIEKKEYLYNHYVVQKLSLRDIANLSGTYTNKIRRDAIKCNIVLRDKSTAQVNALKNGTHKHPTKGVSRSEETKMKIGSSVMKAWEDLTPTELEGRKNTSKRIWENKTTVDKENLLIKANSAVRQSSKSGSKLEKFILQDLVSHSFKVDFHKEQSLVNTKLQIDLFLPNINVAIEVDGPSHFLPVWGEDSLKKNKKYDDKKTGLILGKGLVLIRIKQVKDFSKARAKEVCNNLIVELNKINNKFPPVGQRLILIGDSNE